MAQSTNKDSLSLDQLLAGLPPGSVQTARPTRTNASEFEFAAAVQEHLGSRLNTIKLEDVIAWAIKCDTSSVPPLVMEEAVVRVEWSDQTNRNHVLLAVMMSDTSTPARRPAWRVQPNRVTTGCEEFDSNPSADQIARFIESSNFGTNECVYWLSVLRTITYTTNPVVVEALQSAIPEEEKRKRFGLLHFQHRPGQK